MTDMGAMQDRLYGKLCHTTHPERFLGIMNSGRIKVDPDISDADRWGGSTPDKFGFVRLLGGVSLFDFDQFDPKKYQQDYPSSSWHEFVPYRRNWGGAVWIVIDREAVSTALISGADLIEIWRDGYHRHRVMPRIEAAHIGDIPVSAFHSAFVTWADGDTVQDVDLLNFKKDDYNQVLAKWQEEGAHSRP